MCPSFKAALDAGKPIKIDAHHALTLADGKNFKKAFVYILLIYC